MTKWVISDTPSPEAIVRATLEVASDEIDQLVKLPVDDVSRGYNKAVEEVLDIIRCIAASKVEVAQIIKKAQDDRG